MCSGLTLTTSLGAHTGPVNVVRYNHGAKYCLTGSSDRSIRLWNPSLGKEIKAYSGHAQEVLCLDMYAVLPEPDGDLTRRAQDNAKFASCGGDKIAFVWDVAAGVIVRRLQGHFGKINAVAFSKDAQLLATGQSRYGKWS